MTGPGQPRTCSHLINARMFTGVCQAVRIFSSYYFHVFVTIETLESDLLSLSIPSGHRFIEPNGHGFILMKDS